MFPFCKRVQNKSLKNLHVTKLNCTGFGSNSTNLKIVYNKETKVNDTGWNVESRKLKLKRKIIKKKLEKKVWLKSRKKKNTHNLYFLAWEIMMNLN